MQSCMASLVQYPGHGSPIQMASIHEKYSIRHIMRCHRMISLPRWSYHGPAKVSSDKDLFSSIYDVPSNIIDVHVGHISMPVFTVDCDYVMDMYIKAGMDDKDPYWTCIWPSSQALAAAVLGQGGDLVRGKRVADFGAGLGLAGVASALALADEVVFLDREPLALECCMINAYLHGCIP